MYIHLLVNAFKIQMHVYEKCYINYKLKKLYSYKMLFTSKLYKTINDTNMSLNRQKSLHAAQTHKTIDSLMI